MKSRELTPEAISASTYRDSVQDAITAAIQTAYSQASKSGLMGAPGAEKIKKRFKEEFPAVLKNQLEQGVEPINLVMFSDATWEAAVSPHNQSLIISYKMTDMISDWVASAITYGAKTGAEIVSEVKKPVDYLSGVIVHEIVHLIQQQRQPGKRKDYHSLLKSSADRFISAVQNLASDEDWDLYHASPQEIPAYAHQMIYRMITQALNGEQLRDIPEDEIPFVIQELRDLLRDVATGVNASGDEIERYLKFKGEDRRRVTVFKRFMKAVYLEVQSYIGQLQAGYRGGQPVTETFNKPQAWRKTYMTFGSAEGIEYFFTTPREQNGTITILIRKGVADIAFNINGSMDVTGGGEAGPIFATVIDCVKDSLKDPKFDLVWGIKFSAENKEPSRVKLYKRLARVLPTGDYKFVGERPGGHHATVYEFVNEKKKKDYDQAESARQQAAMIPPEEQIEEAAIYEVGFSHEVADIDNEQAVIDHSKIDGSISGKDVWRFHNANIDLTIYFFTDNQESIQAWVMLNGNNLMAMKSYSSGLNFALMHYIIDLKGIRLEIKATDTLTADGLKWILGQITRSDGFKITDQRNRPIDPDRLKKEWQRAQSQGPGPTAIWIGESAIANNLRLFEASPTTNDRFGIRQSQTRQVAETGAVTNTNSLAESSLTEIERIPGQDFPIEKTQQILSHCTHDDGDSIDGLKLWMGRNGSERYVILTDDNRNIASYAGFHAIDSHRWQVRNAQTYPGFTGRKLAAKIYKELFGGGVSILSDFQQSSGAEHIWCKNLPAMGVTPMVWDSKSEEIYTADQIGMDKIYSQDPKIMHRYCWILEHHIPSQNLVYEGKMLMPIKGLWYTKRLRFDEMASAGATGSGSVATVAQPLGGVIRRPAIGSSILAGINTAEATPNTPDWMKRYKNRSQNKKRSK